MLISDKVNLWREIENDGAGLVEPDTIEGTRRLLERWIVMDEPARLRMRDRARASFENRFERETGGGCARCRDHGWIKHSRWKCG